MKLKKFYSISLALVLLMPALSACKGRTMDNVEPTGRTAEVIIDTTPQTTIIVSEGPAPSAQEQQKEDEDQIPVITEEDINPEANVNQ